MGLHGKNSGSLFLNLLVSVLLAQPGNGLSDNDWTPPTPPTPPPPPTPPGTFVCELPPSYPQTPEDNT